MSKEKKKVQKDKKSPDGKLNLITALINLIIAITNIIAIIKFRS